MMNQEKAREFFSAYYEASLEPGLRQAFEAKLDSDFELQADYAAFVATMEELETMSLEEIPVPSFLNDRIAARMEVERAKRKPTFLLWNSWLRNLGFASLATAALVGAFFSFGHRGGGSFNAGLTPSGVDGNQLTFTTRDSAVVLNYHPSAAQNVVISSVVTGQEVSRFTADANAAPQTFENPEQDTAIFRVQVQGEPNSTLIAVPGTRAASVTTGEGTLTEFVAALASRYHTPVVVQADDVKEHVTWKMEGTNAHQAAEAALAGHSLVVDQRGDSGILTIGDR